MTEQTIKARMPKGLVIAIDQAAETVRTQSEFNMDRSKALRIGAQLFVKLGPIATSGRSIMSEADLLGAILSRFE